uniref:Ribonuclease A-domain domain-containing protein n=1 Tax=Anguilla anguilla TaxID=7936 RepID=A0A0E9XWT3_ANGAN
MTVKECNEKMAFINKRYNYNPCKRVNSVISALSLDSVNAVCDEEGEPYPMPNRTNLQKSSDQFHVITCNRSNQRGCDYTGSESNEIIIVGCNAGSYL